VFAVDRFEAFANLPLGGAIAHSSYLLQDTNSETRVEIVPDRGGIVTRWQVGDRPVLYLDRDRFADPSLSIRGGIPILFPICGNLPDNTYHAANGQSYTLKQHGFARDLPWQVGDRHTTDHAALTLHLTSNATTRAVYPFEFALAFTYILRGTTLTIAQRVENRDSRPLPFSIGLHPYFAIADKSHLRLDLPASTYRDQKTQTVAPYNDTLDYDAPELDLAFESPQAAEDGTLMAGASDRDLHVTLTAAAPHALWVFWTVAGKDYYCLEPWSGPRNALNTGDRLTTLAPGAALETTVAIAAQRA
jgi:galactose mutarotase-like enzyme